jgi:para-nitrobenzyl esterase
MLEKTETQRIAAEVLSSLKLQPNQVDSLQKIPFPKLADAGKKALKIVAEKMKQEGKPVIGFGLSWGPSRDGEILPYQLFAPEVFELSKNIPLLIGTVKNEFMASLGSGLTNASSEKINEFIKNKFTTKADVYVAAVKKAYPQDTRPSDLIDVDLLFRPGAVVQENLKSAIGGAPVYMYFFSWQSPILEGKMKAAHCMELPFVFNNISRCEEMTGGTKEAYALADKVSQAWINFAKSGDPNHGSLPKWQTYNASVGATMFFDNLCQIRFNHDKELLELMK